MEVLEAAAKVQFKKREANISMAAGLPAAALKAYEAALGEAEAAELDLLSGLLHSNIAAAYLAVSIQLQTVAVAAAQLLLLLNCCLCSAVILQLPRSTPG